MTGEKIIKGLKQAVQHAQGDESVATVHHPMTMNLDDKRVEAAARALCVADGSDPDSTTGRMDGNAAIWEYYVDEVRAAITAYLQAGGGEDGVPTGAIENGRALSMRLIHWYAFECDGGTLEHCGEWQEFLGCFEHLANFATQAATRIEELQAELKDETASANANQALFLKWLARAEAAEQERDARKQAQKSLSGAVAALMQERDALREAYDAACKFIDSHAADPDLTEEMTRNWFVFNGLREHLSQNPCAQSRPDDKRPIDTPEEPTRAPDMGGTMPTDAPDGGAVNG